ncbi:ABC-type cobalamin/Fe3+-siderophores transport system ATPase subunit [Arcticibacter tournemirensis]|uniref:ABC transporter ATP-binding protein n=1 Tax=Arcticibacter tournemirensis TaxID=699437 RepID=A0A5M9HLE6_9SPHI|nr:ABC transporter ATP-binding protein [Arcticibacter tournemirensis]KAA8486228.1 ABC transporter ATP-binding protein [Arcticibacter tournemirensis]TQM52029.1 ABC-type cobalamin/Fe3+-siderophores transport system ATPase subunit [Arcticibacter tournemirensis]
MLEIDSVSLCFGRKQVLSGCYICCKPGEIVGLLGRNGCGKSSLLKIIFGTLKADFMHLKVGSKITKKTFPGKDVAYLPQHNFIPPFLTVRKVLEDCDPSVATEEAVVSLNELKDSRINSLSGGERRFLECLWLLSRPATYLLLDEPFSEIAPFQIEILQDIIRTKGKTKGIILTDHFYLPLMEVSTRIVLMHNNAIYNIRDESDLILYNYIPDFSS